MLVVADASPINILIRIGYMEILPQLFHEVVIPPAVEKELNHAHSPSSVQGWMANRPQWLKVLTPLHVDLALTRDPGEREAISLAQEIKADAILLDDLRARKIARRLGLSVTGTVGVLSLAARRKLIHLQDAVSKLRQTNFHISDELLDEALRESENH